MSGDKKITNQYNLSEALQQTPSYITADDIPDDNHTEWLQMQAILLDISMRFNSLSESGTEPAIQDSLKSIAEYTGADRCYIFDYNLKEKILSNRYLWCNAEIPPQLDGLQKVNLDKTPPWIFLHLRGRVVQYDDILALPFNDKIRNNLEPYGVRSLISLPLDL